MKQTAIEWLEIQLFKKQGKFNKSDIEQAKAMEKEQIIKTAKYYFYERGKLTPEQYYNETFKKE